MYNYRDTALIVRSYDLGEADRIVTLLTGSRGVIRMVAKGVRRTRSKFGARLDVFNTIDAQLYPPKKIDGLGIVQSAVSVSHLSAHISANYNDYTAACVIVEVAEKLSAAVTDSRTEQQTYHNNPRDTHSEKLLNLTCKALQALVDATREIELIVAAYLIRAMAISGWLPALHECAGCGTPGTYSSFNIPLGGVVCDNCRTSDSTTPGLEVITALRAMYVGRWDLVLDKPQVHARALQVSAAYFQWHIGREIGSLTVFNARNNASYDAVAP